MGMGISQKLGNGSGREWELNRWEWEGMGMLKAIPAHLYSALASRITVLFSDFSCSLVTTLHQLLAAGRTIFKAPLARARAPLRIGSVHLFDRLSVCR